MQHIIMPWGANVTISKSLIQIYTARHLLWHPPSRIEGMSENLTMHFPAVTSALSEEARLPTKSSFSIFHVFMSRPAIKRALAITAIRTQGPTRTSLLASPLSFAPHSAGPRARPPKKTPSRAVTEEPLRP